MINENSHGHISAHIWPTWTNELYKIACVKCFRMIYNNAEVFGKGPGRNSTCNVLLNLQSFTYFP